MLKSIGVVVGCYLLSVVLVFATDPLLSRLFPGDFGSGRVPSDTALVASTAFFVVISILCAWLCAHFAPGRAARHVLWFLILGEAMGIALTIPNWSTGLAALVLVILAAHLAGELLDWPAACGAPDGFCRRLSRHLASATGVLVNFRSGSPLPHAVS